MGLSAGTSLCGTSRTARTHRPYQSPVAAEVSAHARKKPCAFVLRLRMLKSIHRSPEGTAGRLKSPTILIQWIRF